MQHYRVFHDVRARPGKMFDARIVALVVHEFYKQRIQRAAQLEAAYQWRAFSQEMLK